MLDSQKHQLLKILRALREQTPVATAHWFGMAKRIAKWQISYSWSASIFQAVFLLMGEYIYLIGVPPGVSVACLAAAAVVMTFRVLEKIGRPEQVIWILIAVMFLPLEIGSINADREATARHDEQLRSEERQQFVSLFQKEADTYTAQQAAQKIQLKQFSRLVSQGQKSLHNLDSVAAGVTQTMGYASGGSSFPMIYANAVTLNDGKEAVGLYFQKIGTYPLFDVTISLGRSYSIANINPQIAVVGARCSLNEVNGSWTMPLLSISIANDTAAYFVADLQARNGSWEEVVDVRRANGKLLSRSLITKVNFPGGPKTIWDIADQDFPVAHRHDVLFPYMSLRHPSIEKLDKTKPDLIWGHFPPGIVGSCIATKGTTAVVGAVTLP